MALDPRALLKGGASAATASEVPLAGSRHQRVQRLQVGLFLLVTMVVMIALADIIISNVQENQAAVPEDLPPVTTEDLPPPAPRDPLVEAGVVPDLPVEQSPVPTGAETPAALETGNAAAASETD